MSYMYYSEKGVLDKPVLILGDDKVSMLTHTDPHKSLQGILRWPSGIKYTDCQLYMWPGVGSGNFMIPNVPTETRRSKQH